MQRITLSFPFKLHPGQLPLFRAAIAQIAGLEHSIFHNHLPDAEDGSPRWAWDYPQVQYRIHRGRPTVVGIGEGAYAILREILPFIPPSLILAEQVYTTSGYRLNQDEVQMSVSDTLQQFGIAQWIALNATNYQDWKEAGEDDQARNAILTRALRGHLSGMARILNPAAVEIANEASIDYVDQVKRMQWHGTPLVAFHVVAISRLIPPKGLGMGRMTAFGFGEVCDAATYVRLLEGKRKLQEMEVL